MPASRSFAHNTRLLPHLNHRQGCHLIHRAYLFTVSDDSLNVTASNQRWRKCSDNSVCSLVNQRNQSQKSCSGIEASLFLFTEQDWMIHWSRLTQTTGHGSVSEQMNKRMFCLIHFDSLSKWTVNIHLDSSIQDYATTELTKAVVLVFSLLHYAATCFHVHWAWFMNYNTQIQATFTYTFKFPLISS